MGRVSAPSTPNNGTRAIKTRPSAPWAPLRHQRLSALMTPFRPGGRPQAKPQHEMNKLTPGRLANYNCRRRKMFYQNLAWLGKEPPSQAENEILLAAIKQMQQQGAEAALPA